MKKEIHVACPCCKNKRLFDADPDTEGKGFSNVMKCTGGEHREAFMEQWTEQLQSENLLEVYRAEKFIEYTDGAETLTEMDTDFLLKTLDHIKVFLIGFFLLFFR